MRWIFFFLIAANVGLLMWRLIGLPEALRPSERAALPVWQVPEGVGTLKLLSELEPSDVERWRSLPEVDVGERLCLTAGPFETPARAEQFIDRLKVLDVYAVSRNLRISGGTGYWVYLQPEKSAELARRRLAELQALGVDSYIIPKGDLANGISLGMYSQRELAVAKVEEMQGRGLEPKIQEIERSHRELWVFLPASEEAKLDPSVWRNLVEQEFSVEERQNFCLDVASG